MFTGFCRLARESELSAIAELRFYGQRSGAAACPSERALFVDDFVRIAAARPRGEVMHWVLEIDGVIIATRSAVVVRQLPEPDVMFSRSALVSRCYRRPGATGNAAAARLLAAIEDWALREGVELIAAREQPSASRDARSQVIGRLAHGHPLLVA